MMSRKFLSDLDVERALEDLFELPDDPEQSEDDLEADDEEAQFSTARLQNILEGLDEDLEEQVITSTPLLENQPSPQSSVTESNCCPLSAIEEIVNSSPTPGCSGSRRAIRSRHTLLTPISAVKRPTPTTQPISEDTATESDTDQSDTDEDVWKKVMWTNRPKPKNFDENPLRPKRRVTNKTRPLCFFQKFFTPEVYDLIISQTNLYAVQEKVPSWIPLELEELKAFIGIIIIMGYHILPSIDLYWSSDPGFRVNEIADTMPIKRFKKILQCLHLNDNTTLPERNSPDYDKLYKVRPLLTMINAACQDNAEDSSSQSIDESMILFKGRSSLKQYMPLKPVKRGYKVWCRCDSQTGYLYEFEIYTGKTLNSVEEGLGANVVKRLTEKLVAKESINVHVTFDNFFCDYKLLEYLYQKGIYASGTVRRHRADMPQLIKGPNGKKLKLKKGDFKWRVKDNVSFVVWQDNKEVLLMSNVFHPKVGKTEVMRTQKDGSKMSVKCPLVTKQYTQRMGGVDRFDQLKSTYTVGRKSKKWWLRIFYFLIDASITNAFILSNTHGINLSHFQFRVALARGLVGGYSSRKRRSVMADYIVRKKVAFTDTTRQKAVGSVSEERRYTNVGDHMPCPLSTYKRCRHCSTKANDKRSKIMCQKCEVPLCIVPCFYAYHHRQ